MSLFHDAALAGDIAVLRRVGKRDLTRIDEQGFTPLHCAARAGQLEAARLLMAKGSDPNALDAHGQTSVHVAARHGHLPLVRHFVEVGSANIWSLSDSNQTACDLAAVHRQTQVFRYLEALQVRLSQDNRSSTEKAKTRALRDFNKRLAAIVKQEAKSTGRRKKLSTSNSAASVDEPPARPSLSRLRAFSEPLETNATPAPGDITAGKTSTGSKGKPQGKSSKLKSVVTAPAIGLRAEGFPKISGIRDKFSLRPSQHSLASIVAAPDSDSASVVTAKSMPAPGRVNKMAQAVNRLQQLGGLGVGDEETLRQNLYSLPVDSDTDVRSTRSDTRDRSRRKQRSVSTSALKHGSSNPEIFKPKAKPQHRQSSLDDDEMTQATSSTAAPAVDTEHSYLASFLHMLDLDSYLGLFEEEQMDIPALMLCSDLDLRDLDIPLGPRRKVLAALRQRKAAISSPGRMTSSHV